MILNRKSKPYIDNAGVEHPKAVLAAFKTSITHGKELSIFLGVFANENTVQIFNPLETIQLRFSKEGVEDYYTPEQRNDKGEITKEKELHALGHAPSAQAFGQLGISFSGIEPNETMLSWLFEQVDNRGEKIGVNWKE